ncbi:hypothetical protein BpHYR1_000820 [Brachionus plicatilis]|uniref:Uncharacterized protein n=1 Tax=Brachionus plicatilis TaxID=10195 RepID=A0A3M7P3T3_BRAPC|nr:hypothetical protein BpHYR1_000820 [Brachionus plicatilis]
MKQMFFFYIILNNFVLKPPAMIVQKNCDICFLLNLKLKLINLNFKFLINHGTGKKKKSYQCFLGLFKSSRDFDSTDFFLAIRKTRPLSARLPLIFRTNRFAFGTSLLSETRSLINEHAISFADRAFRVETTR